MSKPFSEVTALAKALSVEISRCEDCKGVVGGRWQCQGNRGKFSLTASSSFFINNSDDICAK